MKSQQEANALVQTQRGFINDVIKQELPDAIDAMRLVGRAVVTDIASNLSQVKIKRSEESASDGKWYPTLSGYTAEVGDNVLLLRVGPTWLVLGEIRNTVQTPDRDIIAGQRLLADATYTDGSKTALTGAYPVLGQKTGQVGVTPSGSVILHTFSENTRLKIHLAIVVTDGSGNATIALPSAARADAGSRPLVWPSLSPRGATPYALGVGTLTTTAVGITLYTLAGAAVPSTEVGVRIEYIGDA